MPRRRTTAGSIPSIRRDLLAFFDAHRRDLPWRKTRDPYAIWVSEVMLQQTRVETVIPYYTRFLARFPTVHTLADAPLDDVLAHWSGLGYYRRARMLHAGARAVTESHDGRIPDTRDALESIPGIGAYTAGAIASIAYDRREAIVDGNVERVLSRLFALEGNPRTADGKRRVWDLARQFANGDRPGDTNQALMELGATVCIPASPKCDRCPVREACSARAAGEPERYPELAPRRAVRTERWTAVVALDRSKTRVSMRPRTEERWHGMLVPPLVECPGNDPRIRDITKRLDATKSCGSVRHVLTHAAMEIEVLSGISRSKSTRGPEWVPIAELDDRAVPKVTREILRAAGIVGDVGASRETPLRGRKRVTTRRHDE